MQLKIKEATLELVVGNIVDQSTDILVNAANSKLAGGSGVDGAIHQAAGPAVMQQTAQLYPQGCPVGESVISEAGLLAVKYIIHAVGPIWQGGRRDEEGLLRNAYRRALEIAIEYHCESISFPAISTGAYGYPLDLATEAALSEICEFLHQLESPFLVRCVLFDQGTFGAYCRVLENISENN